MLAYKGSICNYFWEWSGSLGLQVKKIKVFSSGLHLNIYAQNPLGLPKLAKGTLNTQITQKLYAYWAM